MGFLRLGKGRKENGRALQDVRAECQRLTAERDQLAAALERERRRAEDAEARARAAVETGAGAGIAPSPGVAGADVSPSPSAAGAETSTPPGAAGADMAAGAEDAEARAHAVDDAGTDISPSPGAAGTGAGAAVGPSPGAAEFGADVAAGASSPAGAAGATTDPAVSTTAARAAGPVEACWPLVLAHLERRWAAGVGATPGARGVGAGPVSAQLTESLGREVDRLREEVGVDVSFTVTEAVEPSNPVVFLLTATDLLGAMASRCERVTVELAGRLIVSGEVWSDLGDELDSSRERALTAGALVDPVEITDQRVRVALHP